MASPREIALSAYYASAREILVEALGMLPENDPVWLELFAKATIQNNFDVSINSRSSARKQDINDFFRELRNSTEFSRNGAVIDAIATFEKSLKDGLTTAKKDLAYYQRDATNIRYCLAENVISDLPDFVNGTMLSTRKIFVIFTIILSLFLVYVGYQIGYYSGV
jgi:hypothetical protein